MLTQKFTDALYALVYACVDVSVCVWFCNFILDHVNVPSYYRSSLKLNVQKIWLSMNLLGIGYGIFPLIAHSSSFEQPPSITSFPISLFVFVRAWNFPFWRWLCVAFSKMMMVVDIRIGLTRFLELSYHRNKYRSKT